MPSLELTAEQKAHADETRQPELWGWLICFIVICNIFVIGRLWGTWMSVSNRSRVIAEDIFIALSGVLLNVIIANLMLATRYGLGLHNYAVNAKDDNYPSNLSKVFMHVWITMVLMSSFFVCIKMTLLLFYKRLFILSSTAMRFFWWANLVYILLWFFGGTGFYLFQCKPVQWYFLQYFARAGKPVPGNMTGQCDATTVLHVSMPMIFSLISDVSLLALPVWAIWKLRLEKRKRMGLIAVFGIGLVACLLELARILALVIDTDDKLDPSYGVAVFLILTAAEETTAVVCACLPVIVPQLYKYTKAFRHRNRTGHSYVKTAVPSSLDVASGGKSGSRNWRSKHSFRRVISVNHMPTTMGAELTRLDGTEVGDHIHLTSIEASRPMSSPNHSDGGLEPSRNREDDVERGGFHSHTTTSDTKGTRRAEPPVSNAIHIPTQPLPAFWTHSGPLSGQFKQNPPTPVCQLGQLQPANCQLNLTTHIKNHPTAIMSAAVEGLKWRNVEVGRVVLLQGDHAQAGQVAVIVEIVDHKRFLVDGPAASAELSVPRQVVAASDVLLTDITIENLPRAARTGTVRAAWEKSEVDAKWKNTSWAKKMEQSRKRKALTDFDRFKVLRLKKQRRFEERKALVQVRASA
ncbi:putative Integral membrane protein [Seiridium cardinale]|uniref:Integral membrane protein n=1 Tax=Seiridium cardinale TaxID=138064 RepID=A0ABR2X7Z2_9PEZI